jgi:hypothetical protein
MENLPEFKNKKYLLIIIILTIVLLSMSSYYISREYFNEERKDDNPEEFVSTDKDIDNFYLYLDLPSISGKFLSFEEEEKEISIIYFNKETSKISAKTFKVDQETLFSKLISESDSPNLFPEKDLLSVDQETKTNIFYNSSEEEKEKPLAKLIQIEVSF